MVSSECHGRRRACREVDGLLQWQVGLANDGDSDGDGDGSDHYTVMRLRVIYDDGGGDEDNDVKMTIIN